MDFGLFFSIITSNSADIVLWNWVLGIAEKNNYCGSEQLNTLQASAYFLRNDVCERCTNPSGLMFMYFLWLCFAVCSTTAGGAMTFVF